MKKILTTISACILLASIGAPAYAKDPCKTVMCMWGVLKGKGIVKNCDEAVNDFKSIQVKKRGKFKPGATSDARQQFLNQCPNDKDQQDQIINKYGTKRW